MEGINEINQLPKGWKWGKLEKPGKIISAEMS